MQKTFSGLKAKALVSVCGIQAKLREKKGSFFTEHGLAIVITVVIAAIVLVGATSLMENNIFPSLESKVDEFFNLAP